MFQWDKTISAINIPASKVVHLFRSMRDVQLALPGISAQQASAFLCQYHVGNGVGTVAVFHLHKNQILAFYFSDPRVVPEQKIETMLDQGLNFVESMGFLMTDQDLHLLDESDQEILWSSLPIKTGLPGGAAESPPAAITTNRTEEKPIAKVEVIKVDAAQVENKQALASVASNQAVGQVTQIVAPEKVAPRVDSKPEASENVDDLLAAVEAMRAKRPGLNVRRSAPSDEEMGHRRRQLCKTVGRILASL